MKRILEYLKLIKNMSLTKKASLALVLFFVIVLLKNVITATIKKGNVPTEAPFRTIVLPEMVMRNDSSGFGFFGAWRSGQTRKHKGTDVLVYKGQPIYSPFTGTITRTYKAYANDDKYKGIEIISTDQKYKVKIMYCTLIGVSLPKTIKQGELVAYAQSISEKYGGPMKDHVHLELYEDGLLVDPQKHFFIK